MDGNLHSQEEEEDECEEGEINENDDAQENSKVPESDFHGNCVDGDKPEDEGYVENSRLFSKPNNVEVQIGENDEYIDTPIGDTSDAHNLVEHVLKEGDCHVLSNQNIPNNRIAEIEDEGVGELRLDTNYVHVGNDEGACDQVEVDPVGIALNSQKNKGIQAQFYQNGSSGCQGVEGYVEPLNQVDVSNDEDRSVQDTLDLDGGESSQSIDLNSEPLDIYDWYDIADEEARRRGRAKKSKSKDKRAKKQGIAKSSSFPATMKSKDILKANAYRKNKKADHNYKNQSSPNKSENSITISEEILKTKNIGAEVGFQIEGFDELLRNEIEGEGMIRNQS
ncbi:hypothetical protein L2E82_04978 [Cichorium intybus]|uniref:Uncharacterized protein n=1 Tax=Cichorium intybus TaxID=13427 RepID=A0ACB9H7I0_CICIN|nr:hypothetical protein L2E82_04978 [Cichorium intybus]